MKLDRNLNQDRRGKYALLKLRNVPEPQPIMEATPNSLAISDAIRLLEEAGILDWGIEGTDGEPFVILLKDKYAQSALVAYADAAEADDPEWAMEVRELAARAGPAHPNCKRPD